MAKKLIMTVGLPGSGKSTWALDIKRNHSNPEDVIIVNKDDIRAELVKKGWTWSHKDEKDVIEIRDARIKQALQQNKFAISTDTNFGKKHETRLKELAKAYGAEFEIKSFLEVPIEVCIQRDATREGKARVGEEVIRKMASQFNITNIPKIEPFTPDESLPQAIIVDLDGTLSLFKEKGHRGPYDASKCDEDDVNEAVKSVVLMAWSFNWKLIFLSGRYEEFEAQTRKFLQKHLPEIPYFLFMRKNGDKRKDFIVKLEIFNEKVRNNFDVQFVLDDRNQVVKMWRELGLDCFQVADGDF